MSNENKIKITFVINGQPTTVHANVHAPLRSAVAKALEESGNTGREPSEWELRDSNGTLIEQGQSPLDLGYNEEVTLFLSLRVGAGGCDASLAGC
jgi:hypothetical protein